MSNSSTPTRDSNQENHYEGLISSMRHARNRLLFFLIFAAYNFLAILGTSDTMLFLESPVIVPFLSIELPLLAFYAVMPLFLLILYFHLLYTFRSYRQFLLDSQAENIALLKYLPIGLYEGALLHQDGFHRGVRFAMRVLLYFFPLLVFTAFWFRFADYQSPALSLWHLMVLVTASLFSLYFRGLLKQIEPQRLSLRPLFSRQYWITLSRQWQHHQENTSQAGYSWQVIQIVLIKSISLIIDFIKKYRSLLMINMGLLVFFTSIFTYHIKVIYPLSRKNIAIDEAIKLAEIKLSLQDIDKKLEDGKGNPLAVKALEKNQESLKKLETLEKTNKISKIKVTLDNLKVLERKIDNKLQGFLNRDQWFLPRIIINGEMLVTLDKDQLNILKILNNSYKNSLQLSKKQVSLLLLVPLQDQSQRNFRLIDLTNCILPRINFNNSQLQGASLISAQLQGASLISAQLQGAYLRSAQLQGVSLISAQLQGASLRSVQLQGAYLRSAQLQGADLRSAQLQGASLISAQLQGASLISAQLQGADLRSAQLQGASLISVQLQGADLRSAQLQGADLWGAQLQGSDLRVAQLQGVQTSGNDFSFIKSKAQVANISNINSTALSKQESNKTIQSIQPYINMENKLQVENSNQAKQRLKDAIDKDPIQWVKDQKDINLGILTEEKFNKIANSITEPSARRNMGLPPLDFPSKENIDDKNMR